MLVFLDVDGTLVGADGFVSDDALEAADVLREMGARLVVATGRPAGSTTREIVERLDPAAPHIYLNGALVQTGRGRTVHEEPFGADLLAPQIDAAREWDATLELYTDAEIFVDELTPPSREHAEYVGLTPEERDLREVAEAESVLKTQWIVGPERAEDVLELELPEGEAAAATSPVMPDAVFVSVTHLDATKGVAGERVASHLGMEMAAAAAAGDGESDRPLLERVGHPFVMADAPDALKETYTTVGAVDEDGVLEVFEHVAQAIYRHE